MKTKKKKNPINEVTKGLDEIDRKFSKGMGNLLDFKKNTQRNKKVIKYG